MQVSIIIVNYNTRELTINCIESIYKYTEEIEFEIIVVDNASSDESILAITEKFPQVNIIEAGSNLGFGRANNLGVKNALGEYLFFLNSDTVLIENSVEILLRHYKYFESTNQKIGILGAILIDSTGKVASLGGDLPTAISHIYINFKKLASKTYNTGKKIDTKKKIYQVGMVSGADMFIRRETFERIQGFDKEIFLYYEDTDLNKRLKDLGYYHFIDTTTKIVHFEGGSAKMSHWKRSVIHESQNYFFKKHSNKLTYTVYLIYQIAFSLFSLKNRDFTFRDNIDFLKKNLKALKNIGIK